MTSTPVAAARCDSFGNPIDPVVGYARGRILNSSIAEARRLRHGQHLAASRVRAHGPESIAVFTGNQRDFPLRPADLADLAEEWVGPGLFAENLRMVALTHLGGRPDDAAAVFNRTSAGIIATINALARGRVVVSVVPRSARSHASVVRGSTLACADLHEVHADQDWQPRISELRPALVVITTVTSSLERLPDTITEAVVTHAQANNATVLLDEAYGARLRPVLHGGRLSLQLGDADLAITNCDKAGLAGPRAGVLAGRPALVTAVAAWAAEHGSEARAPIAAGVLRSLEQFNPEHLRAESAAGAELADALTARLGDVVQRSDLGPMIHEDAMHTLALERAGLKDHDCPLVPCETTAALGALLLTEYGILTVNTHGQPGARVSLRLKPTLDALRRTGGPTAVAEAVDTALDTLARSMSDATAIARLIIGSDQ